MNIKKQYKKMLFLLTSYLLLFIQVTTACTTPKLYTLPTTSTLSTKQETSQTLNRFKISHLGSTGIYTAGVSDNGNHLEYSALMYPTKVMKLRKSSLLRALKHADGHWNYSNINIPLATSDHRQLYRGVVFWTVFAFLILEVIATFLLNDALYLNQNFHLLSITYITILFFVWGAISLRVIDHKRDLKIVRLVEKKLTLYNKNKDNVYADPQIINVVKKFEDLTGWTVAWTDNPYVLVWPQAKGSKEVVCNIGWLLESENRDEVWRWPYFNNSILRVLREHKKMPKPQSQAIFATYLTST
ncbi:MAG: hypothetical protein JW938_05895 [Candidatus Omnitrophica bacterium]|nr:hypothetical protein [Candidatus Omnitrophota bacterium]